MAEAPRSQGARTARVAAVRYGKLELVESAKTVTARGFFSAEAEASAEMLIDAFRAAAQLDAVGEGTYFVLVDYQREEGYALTIGEGTSSLERLPQKKALAKHARLDAFLEACAMADVPAPPTAAPGSRLREASTKALAALKARPEAEVLAAWDRIKTTTMTTAAFAVPKKDEKKLLALFDAPPKFGWVAALPLRLLAELEGDAATPTIHELLRDRTVAQEENAMLLEALSRSKQDASLDVLLDVLDRGEQLDKNVANRALAFSDHPRATAVVVERARAWLDHVIDFAEKRVEVARPDLDGVRVMAVLEQRGDDACRAMLHTIFARLSGVRGKLPGGPQIPAHAARAYITSSLRGLGEATARKIATSLPGPRAPLESWAKAMELVDAARR